MRDRLLPLLLSGSVLLILASPAHAALTLDRVVIGQGGGQVSNGSLVMDLTIGEAVVGNVSAGQTSVDYGYWWSVLIANVGVGDKALPVRFALRQSAPNPFTTRTQINYAIPQGQHVPVFIGIYDVRGALVKTLVREPQGAGTYAVNWDGRSDSGGLPGAGVYFAKFHAGSFDATRKLVMLK